MRKQDKYIFTGVVVTASIVGILDYFQQKERLKKSGQKMTWQNFNGVQTIKKMTLFGIAGGFAGNEIYKRNFQEESKKPFSSDAFLKDILVEESANSNPAKLQELKSITKEVKAVLYDEFAGQLVTYPESVGSLPKKTAIAGTFDSDIVLPIKKEHNFGNMSNLSSQIHGKIEELFEEEAIVTKRTRATSLTFQGTEGIHKVDVVYGKEIGNYQEDQNLNLYVRPSYFWQKGKTFKTNIDIQKNLLINRPKVREVIKVLKSYRDRNNLDLNNLLIEQLSIEALSVNNFGRDFSLTENLKKCMEYIACKLSNNRVLDYANSNHNLLNNIDYSNKQFILNSITNDLSRIKSNPHYIKEIFHC
ncbi:hypothetical protein [Flavobacterium terrisoli]|uniref:hypothetical protein n=1 Tax=Flavobacterium terrisoli TaxID=3242195 RepID=UPI002542840F|nr:hypothetical protein [Flavobacterium buctense]